MRWNISTEFPGELGCLHSLLTTECVCLAGPETRLDPRMQSLTRARCNASSPQHGLDSWTSTHSLTYSAPSHALITFRASSVNILHEFRLWPMPAPRRTSALRADDEVPAIEGVNEHQPRSP